jgi:uncharacterized membrane protein YidH (DUF202 family)
LSILLIVFSALGIYDNNEKQKNKDYKTNEQTYKWTSIALVFLSVVATVLILIETFD